MIRTGIISEHKVSNPGKLNRLITANKFLKIIGNHGRRFFYHKSRYSQLEIDWKTGHIYLRDCWSLNKIYTHYTGNYWRGFSGGGTLKNLIIALREYVMGRGELPINHLGPWPKELCGGDLWGYGDSMEQVRKECKELEV